jgi:hypothetical protein
MTDTNNVIGSDDIRAGADAHGDIVAARGVAIEGATTGGRVLGAFGVAIERFKTVGRVVEAFGNTATGFAALYKNSTGRESPGGSVGQL